MKIKFHKYHGTGNDFVLIDNRQGRINLKEFQVRNICHRRFGIGADGLMLLDPSSNYDFEMKYYNSDGKIGSLCGNGGRCITAFAYHLGIIHNKTNFSASDGVHEALIKHTSDNDLVISLKMNDVDQIKKEKTSFIINTGSPHYIEFIEDLTKIDIVKQGTKIRWDERYQPEGVNVNFVEENGENLNVGTFERGVEDMTLSCGTGITAAALAASIKSKNNNNYYHIHTLGGKLIVHFNRSGDKCTNIWLEGPAKKVFEGSIQI